MGLEGQRQPGRTLLIVVPEEGSCLKAERAALENRLVVLHWNPATPCTGYVAFSWKREGPDLVIAALAPRTDAGWLEEAYPGVWKAVDCTPWTGWPASDPTLAQVARAAAISSEGGSLRADLSFQREAVDLQVP